MQGGAFAAGVHGAIGAPPLGTEGSAHRAGRLRGSYKVLRQISGILYSRMQKGGAVSRQVV